MKKKINHTSILKPVGNPELPLDLIKVVVLPLQSQLTLEHLEAEVGVGYRELLHPRFKALHRTLDLNQAGVSNHSIRCPCQEAFLDVNE